MPKASARQRDKCLSAPLFKEKMKFLGMFIFLSLFKLGIFLIMGRQNPEGFQ